MDRPPGEPENGDASEGSPNKNPLPSILAPSFDFDSPSLQSESMLGPPPSASAFHTNFEVPSSPSFDHSSFTFGASPTTAYSTPPSLYLTPPIQHTPPSSDVPSFQPYSHRRTPSASFSPSHSPGSVPMSPISRSASPKRHTRIHSRNLSVFFPRPDVEKATSIPEDEGDNGQTLEYKTMDAPPSSARLAKFKFGGRLAFENGMHDDGAPTKRRGHHHKHSVSHNFFSFMEPGQTPQTEASPFLPESPFPGTTSTPRVSSGTSERRDLRQPLPISHKRLQSEHLLSRYFNDPERTAALAFFVAEIILGAWLWIAGQSRGSLACTGLGYWIVFDSLGVTLSSRVFPSLWSLGTQDVDLRKPFGTKRLETTASFAQSIYLVFSAVYVLKEAVERFLLSSAGDDPHHHHSQAASHSFPTLLLWLSLGSLLLSNLAYRNHSHLVDAVGSLLPHPTTALASVPFLRRSARLVLNALHSSPLASRVLSNQFTLAPTTFVLLLLYASHFADQSQQVTFDMLVSSLETIWTFSIAYPSAVSLGKILLQTAPERSRSGGSLESFQRAIREIRRDPRVLQVPDTYLWQLTHHRSPSVSANDAEELVSAVNVHVQKEASDMDILDITKWASDKISIALGKPRVGSVTVSVVRG